MSKPVLVLVMADTCGACQKFKATALPSIESEIKNRNKVELIELQFPERQVPPEDTDMKFEYHPGLQTFARWFPTFILFPSNLWFDKGSKLKGVIKNEKEVTNGTYPDYSKASILKWIDETLETDPIFNSKAVLKTNELVRQTKKGTYMVPTHGTYTKFINSKMSESY